MAPGAKALDTAKIVIAFTRPPLIQILRPLRMSMTKKETIVVFTN